MAATGRLISMRCVKICAWVAITLVAGACSSGSSGSAVRHESATSGLAALSMTDLTAPAPQACPRQQFPLRQPTRVSRSAASSVIQGYVPTRLPDGFGLQEVDRIEPGGGGYAAWTDARCRRVAIFIDPGNSAVAAPARPAFGPWLEPQRCGTPRPCIVYERKVNGGMITFSTWQLDPATAVAILHTIDTSPS
jgi:hypothetical protein